MKGIDGLTQQDRDALFKVTCDGCSHDITYTAWASEARLKLTTEGKAHTGGAMYPESKRPLIGRDYHFCSVNCLAEWSGSFS